MGYPEVLDLVLEERPASGRDAASRCWPWARPSPPARPAPPSFGDLHVVAYAKRHLGLTAGTYDQAAWSGSSPSWPSSSIWSK